MGIQTPGAVDYHLTNTTGALSINPMLPCTLACWINGTLSTGNTYSMVGTYNSSSAGGTAIQLGTKNAAGLFAVWTWGGGILVDTQASGGGLLITIPDNTWHHYTYTFDGTLHKLYIDGNLINTVNNATHTSSVTGITTYTSQIAGTITAVYINGFPSGGAAETGTFSVADISYFNRCITPAEVQTLYNCDGGRDGIVYGKVSSYYLNEGSIGSTASSIIDESGLGNTLVPIGGATGVNFTYVIDPLSGDTNPPQG